MIGVNILRSEISPGRMLRTYSGYWSSAYFPLVTDNRTYVRHHRRWYVRDRISHVLPSSVELSGVYDNSVRLKIDNRVCYAFLLVACDELDILRLFAD